MKTQTITLEKLCLWGIIALALIARFRYLVYIEHNIDQAYPIWQALNTLDNGVFPTIGQRTSILFPNPPMTGYIYLPFVALTRSILGVEILVIALNTLAVWMAYRVAGYMVGSRWALVVALIMAVNPFIIEYSRATWVQSLLPFYATAILWQLIPVLLNKTRRPNRRLIFAAILFALIANSYLLAFLWGAPIVLLLMLFYKRVNWRVVMFCVGVVMVIIAPYALTILTDWDTIQTVVGDAERNPSQFKTDAWEHALRLVTGGEYERSRGLDAPIDDFSIRHTLAQILHIIGAIFIYIGIGRAVWLIYRREKGADGWIIALVWFFIPIIAMTYTGNLVHPFYQLLGVPMGAVLLVLGMKTVLSAVPMPIQPRLVWIGAIVLSFWAGLMLINHARFSEETVHTPGAHDLGALPIIAGLELAKRVNAIGGVVYADMPQWVMNSFAGHAFLLVRDNRAPYFTMYPPEGGVYVTLGDDVPMLSSQDTLTLSDNTVIHLYHLPTHEQVLESVATLMHVPTTQGLRLIGYTLDENVIRIFWQVDFIAPEVKDLIMGTFVHVYNADGERVINTGGGALDGWRWRVGDIYVDQISLDFPDDGAPFTIQFGGYDGVHNMNLLFDFPDDDLPASTVMIIENIHP